MRAARVTRLEGPAGVEVVEVEEPRRQPDDVIVDVHAAGVNFPDVLLARGLYQMRPDLPFVLGSECAGVVSEVPEGSRFTPGDRVAAFPLLGGFAERAAVPESCLFTLPDSLSLTTAAALPMNYLTAHFALTRRGHLRAGETVLVHGAGGGIGTAATQLAKALGARVVAVVSTPEKGEVARGVGADEVVLADGFVEEVRMHTGGRGVDVVVDPVGGERFTDSLRSLAPEGRLLVIGFTAGEIPTVRVNRLLLGNTSVVGVAWGALWSREIDYLQEQWADLLPLVERGAIAPPVSAVHPLEDVSVALAEIEERRATGKIVVATR